jgi:O-methyltransferase
MFKNTGNSSIRRMITNLIFQYRLYPTDFDEDIISLIKGLKPYTMTSAERLFALVEAVKYVVKSNIAGSIVECGVWRGGSMMAVARTLQKLGKSDIDLYLYDTYKGMTEPTSADISSKGKSAPREYKRMKRKDDSTEWCFASLEEVQRNLFSTGYLQDHLKFIGGKVEDTIPDFAPDSISILRLDTDWYESTKHELIHLFPRLSVGGVLIIDDYGYWQGSKKALDEYLTDNNINLLLNRIDNTGRIAVKL